MDLKTLLESGKICYEVIAGSHAYGLNNENSDIDTRGIFIHPIEDYLTLNEPEKQINDEKHDITYYSLKRFFELARTANPNIIELLFMPDDCIRKRNEIFDILIENRNLFISKKAYFTHAKYAEAQIKKAKGANKKVHNPQPKERPVKEDFCWAIPIEEMYESDDGVYHPLFPFRPIRMSEIDKDIPDLSECHVAALEHVSNTYRVYHYGKDAKGVFRGDDMLVCESIPKEDEHKRFIGILIYNQHEYDKALREWNSYWDWMEFRNDKRWIDQESGKLNYDSKNMCHCMRLLLSAQNILEKGEPIVRFEGKQHRYLMDIRAGKVEYDEIMNSVDEKIELLEQLYETSDIPDKVDDEKINKLYKELIYRSQLPRH